MSWSNPDTIKAAEAAKAEVPPHPVDVAFDDMLRRVREIEILTVQGEITVRVLEAMAPFLREAMKQRHPMATSEHLAGIADGMGTALYCVKETGAAEAAAGMLGRVTKRAAGL